MRLLVLMMSVSTTRSPCRAPALTSPRKPRRPKRVAARCTVTGRGLFHQAGEGQGSGVFGDRYRRRSRRLANVGTWPSRRRCIHEPPRA